MDWYFNRGIEREATLLDEANFSRNAFPMFTTTRLRLIDMVRGGDVEMGYSCPGGTNEIRNWIADYESQLEGAEVKPENVVVNNGGCTGTINNLLRIISRESSKKRILIPKPAYPGIITSAEYNGLQPFFVDTFFEHGFRPSAAEISRHLGDVGAIFLTTPGNPSCTYLHESELRKIIEMAENNGIYVIVDAIFEETSFNDRKQRSFALGKDYAKFIKIKGPSKDRPQLNDFRIGWALCNCQDLSNKLIEAAEVSSFSSSTLIEKAVIDDIRCRDALLYMLRKRHDYVLECATLEEIVAYQKDLGEFKRRIKRGVQKSLIVLQQSDSIDKIVVPEAGNMLFARVKKTRSVKDSHELSQYVLDKANIMITPGHVFMMPPKELWFRITMSKDPSFFVKKARELIKTLEEITR